jgi:hypothetical protein
MRRFLTFALLASALVARALATDIPGPVPSQQTILLTPYGTWAMCQENPSMATSPFCTAMPVYIKGQEPDLLLVTAVRGDTIAFAYSVTGTDINGEQKTYTGTFLRNDKPPRVTASYTVINAGTLTNVTIDIQELSSTLSRQQTQNTAGN